MIVFLLQSIDRFGERRALALVAGDDLLRARGGCFGRRVKTLRLAFDFLRRLGRARGHSRRGVLQGRDQARYRAVLGMETLARVARGGAGVVQAFGERFGRGEHRVVKRLRELRQFLAFGAELAGRALDAFLRGHRRALDDGQAFVRLRLKRRHALGRGIDRGIEKIELAADCAAELRQAAGRVVLRLGEFGGGEGELCRLASQDPHLARQQRDEDHENDGDDENCRDQTQKLCRKLTVLNKLVPPEPADEVCTDSA